mgnify:CR=1 FL=1
MSMHSEQINEIATALAKAQSEIKNASEDKTNPHFKSSYASLASVWDACRDAITKNGIAVVQLPFAENDSLFLTTMLTHSSGQWLKSIIPSGSTRDKPHVMGSNLTYSRRYALAAMVGVAPGDDDDANAAQFNDVKQKAKNIPICNEIKPTGYDDFLKKNDIIPGTQQHSYVKFVCEKTGKTETQIIASAMQNEAGFLGQYQKWLDSKNHETKVSEMTG